MKFSALGEIFYLNQELILQLFAVQLLRLLSISIDTCLAYLLYSNIARIF